MIRRTFTALLPLLLLVAACGDDDGSGTASASGSGSGSGSASASASASGSASDSASAAAAGCEVVDGSSEEPTGTLDATLTEYAIEAPSSVEAGVVAITAVNDGSVDHELVVLGVPADEIEVGDDGAPIEVELVGEIEAFPAGETCEGAFSLAPGEYTLLCAIVEESGESHYGEGMVTGLTVT